MLGLFKRLFGGLGRLIGKALQSAFVRGLSDTVVSAALGYVRTAASQLPDNDARREWVVQQLVRHLKIPESIARIAVELAVRLYKDEIAEAHQPAA